MGAEGAADGELCPDCGQSYKNLPNHWRLSSHCEYPVLNSHQQELTAGLLLSGGLLANTNSEKHNPALSTTSVTKPFLEWLDDHFGVLSTGYSERETTAEVHEQRTGNRAEFTGSETQIYQWRSKNLPLFENFVEAWYPNGEKTIPDGLTPTPTILRVAYAKVGTVQTYHGTEKAVFTVTRLVADESDFMTLLEPFEPRIIKSNTTAETSVQQVQLQDTRGFFRYVGYEPIPGFKDKWPDTTTSLSTVDESWAVCPDCGSRFRNLGNHWASETTPCTYPTLTEHQDAILRGLIIGGATPRKRTSSQYPSLEVDTTDREFLEWISTQLGAVAGTITEKRSAVEGTAHARDGLDLSDEAAFGAVYRIQIRTHPVFEQWQSDNESQSKTMAPLLDPCTPDMLDCLFRFRGTYRKRGDTPVPCIRTNALQISGPDLCAALQEVGITADYDHHSCQRSPVVVIQDADAFSQYLD